MLYGAAAWDPVLIISQIVSLQCLFYLTIGLCQAIFLGPSIGSISIHYIFSWKPIGIHSTVGWLVITSNLATACLGAVYLMWIVERAKKCVDFASTTYLLHLVFCCIHSGFPMSLVWWLTNSIGLLTMALLGEWLCVRRELADIPLNTLRGRGASSTGGNTAGGTSNGSKSERQALLEMPAVGSSSTTASANTVPKRALSSSSGLMRPQSQNGEPPV